MEVNEFLRALPDAATSPYAFAAYVFLVFSNFVIAWRVRRNKNLLDAIEKLPEDKRLKALELEMGNVHPKHGLTAEQWLRSKIHQYYFMAFIALAICGTIVLVVAHSKKDDKDNWKSESVIKRLNHGVSKEYIRARIGVPLISRSVSNELGLRPVTYERYGDNEAEIQILYMNDELIGYVLRNFQPNKSIKRSFRINGKEWTFGQSNFGDIGITPVLYKDRELKGKSICKIEKHYFGNPGGYQDYYFSSSLSDDIEPSEAPAAMVPNSLMVIQSDEICPEREDRDQSEECNESLLRLVCTYGEDSLG